jgi:hypothetical protein
MEMTIEKLEQLRELDKIAWRCFHCDFVTADPKEALAHFGDRDDAEEFKPICKWWEGMDTAERKEALQDTIQQVNERDEEIAQLLTKVDAAESRASRAEQALKEALAGADRNLAAYDRAVADGIKGHQLP